VDERATGTTDDPLHEALALIESGRQQAVPLRLVGGLAVRVLTPQFPPRARKGQDLDLASISRVRPRLTQLLEGRGYQPDKRFNALYGHKQLYFRSPEGRTVDVLVDRIEMCHELVFTERIERMPVTLDVTDLLLSKLQIVELNAKDVQDIVYLLSAFPVKTGDEPGTIGLDRVTSLLSEDWGWWRTVSANLERVQHHAGPAATVSTPVGATYRPGEQIAAIQAAVQAAPKTLAWKMRARVGDRKRWYRVPQEDSHD
jgi:hypothetical protein